MQRAEETIGYNGTHSNHVVWSETKPLINPLNMPETLEYIDENYSFYEKFNGYVFYKKN